jgi:hypothetical protein
MVKQINLQFAIAFVQCALVDQLSSLFFQT